MGRKELVYIWSDEHKSYWMPHGCGYTVDGLDAGIWEKEEAERIIKPNGEEKKLSLIPATLREKSLAAERLIQETYISLCGWGMTATTSEENEAFIRRLIDDYSRFERENNFR